MSDCHGSSARTWCGRAVAVRRSGTASRARCFGRDAAVLAERRNSRRNSGMPLRLWPLLVPEDSTGFREGPRGQPNGSSWPPVAMRIRLYIRRRWDRFARVANARTRLPISPTVQSHQVHLRRPSAAASDGRPLLQRPRPRSSKFVETSTSEAPRRLLTVIGRASAEGNRGIITRSTFVWMQVSKPVQFRTNANKI